MMLKTAFRSIFAHKAKSIVLFVVLAFGGLLTMTGLSFMHTFTTNLRTGLTEAVTGDIVLHSSKVEKQVDILMPFQEIEPIEDYENAFNVMEELEVNNKTEQIKYTTPLSKDFAVILDPETKEMDNGLPIVGAKVEEYMRIFRKTKVVARLKKDGKGIIMTEKYLENFPKDRKEIFIGLLPEEEKQQIIDGFSEENKKKVESLSDSNKMTHFVYYMTKDEREEYVENLSKKKKREIVINHYKKFFDDIEIVEEIETTNPENPLIPKGEQGIIMSKRYIDAMMTSRNPKLAQRYRDIYRVGSTLEMSSFTKTGSVSIIDIKVYAVLDIEGSDLAIMNNLLNFETFQKFVGYDAESKILSEEQKKLLEKHEEDLEADTDELNEFGDIDSLFSDNEDTENSGNSDDFGEDDWFSDEEEEEKVEIDPEELGTGQTQYITARLKNPAMMTPIVNKLNKTFRAKGIPDEINFDELIITKTYTIKGSLRSQDGISGKDKSFWESIGKKNEKYIRDKYTKDEEKNTYVLKDGLTMGERYHIYNILKRIQNFPTNGKYDYKAVGYLQSSGSLGGFTSILSIVIMGIIIIIQIISIIVIMNSVLMSVLERINEIGTMRAIGAQKKYVFGLINTEIIILALAASIVGIILASLVLWVVGLFDIPAENFIVGILFGGETLEPTTNYIYVILTSVIIVFTTFVATLYPVIIATKVSPLEAINKV